MSVFPSFTYHHSSDLIKIIGDRTQIALSRIRAKKVKERLPVVSVFHFADTFDSQHGGFRCRATLTHFSQRAVRENNIRRHLLTCSNFPTKQAKLLEQGVIDSGDALTCCLRTFW